MGRYIEFTLSDGSAVVIESDEPGAGVVHAGRAGVDIIERAAKTFEDAVEKAQRAVAVVVEKTRSIHKPDELEITFGLKASGELGTLIVAKASISLRP